MEYLTFVFLLAVLIIILAVPAMIIYLAFWILPRSFKLLRIRLRKVDAIIAEDDRQRKAEKLAKKHAKKNGKSTGFKPKQWYPTGWTYNDETGLWEPPDYIQK